MWTPRRVLLLLGGFAAVRRGVRRLRPTPSAGSTACRSSPTSAASRPTASSARRPAAVSPTIAAAPRGVRPRVPRDRTRTIYPTNSRSATATRRSCSPPARRRQPGLRTASRSPRSAWRLRQAASRPTCGSRARSPRSARFHADKAVLEFDRGDHGPTDMNKAKLLRLELVSEPEQATAGPAARHGPHHQQPAVGRPEPVPGAPHPRAGVLPRPEDTPARRRAGPDFWTDAAVEIVDRQNLPRGVRRAAAPQTAPASGEEPRRRRSSPTSSPAAASRRRPSRPSG